ncbi:MAG: DUF4276 family protein [Hymenobacter sp.]|nr:MAG: DUF4276 family protein [Hymenobacter sp.]
MQIDFLLEEESAVAALRVLLPRLLPGCECRLKPFEGCHDLLGQLPQLLPAYRQRMAQAGQENLRLVVLLDADTIGPRRLADLERHAAAAGLLTYAAAPAGGQFQVLNCLTVQELEAWFLGDEAALRVAYPALKPAHFTRVGANPDILPKPNETLWHILKQGRYYLSGKAKTEWATTIAPHLDPTRNSSPSFLSFCQGLAAWR